MAEAKLHIITSSDLDSMSLSSVQTTESGMGVDNLLDSRRGNIARWTGETSITIKAERQDDLASFFANGFGMARHNFEDDVTVRLRLYPNLVQGGTVVYDSTALPIAVVKPFDEWRPGIDPWADVYKLADGIPKIFAHWFDSSIAYKSIQIDISNPSGSFIDIGRLYLGLAFKPSTNMSWGNALEWVDPSLHTRTAGGGLRTDEIEQYRAFNIPLDWMTNADRSILSNQLGLIGKGGDMLLSLDPTATGLLGLENTMVCKRTSNNKFIHVKGNRYTNRLTVEES